MMIDCLRKILIVIIVMFAVLPTVHAEDYDSKEIFVPDSECETIKMNFNSSKHFKLDSDIKRVFVGSSKLVTLKQLEPSMNEFVVTSLGVEGTTTLFVWTVDGAKHEYLINVVNDEFGLSAEIEEVIGLPDVHVKKIGDRLLLTGTVENQYERNYAIQIARLYVGGGSESSLNFGSNADTRLSTQSSDADHSNTILSQMNKVQDEGDVIDLLQMRNPIQIRLEAQVVEINSDKVKDLGLEYGTSGSGGTFNFGENYDRSIDGVPRVVDRPLKWIEQRFGPINATIHALVTNGNARILSRPSVTTLSGEQATIQIGGKVPYQAIDRSTGITTTTFEDYGIILQFKPIVDEQNRIVSTVHTEVSNLSGQSVNGQPIIATRRADSVINLDSGSTMVVGGLMDSTESKAVSKIPLLGDIPVIGEFFKYTSKRRDKRELVILVTPYIVESNRASQARMSDSMRDYYKQGQLEHNGLNKVDLNDSTTDDQ